jgi:hypothetical protein
MKAALKISIKRMVYRVDLHRDGVFDIYATRCYPANLNDNRGVPIFSELFPLKSSGSVKMFFDACIYLFCLVAVNKANKASVFNTVIKIKV